MFPVQFALLVIPPVLEATAPLVTPLLVIVALFEIPPFASRVEPASTVSVPAPELVRRPDTVRTPTFDTGGTAAASPTSSVPLLLTGGVTCRSPDTVRVLPALLFTLPVTLPL